MQRPGTHINAATESFVSYDAAVILSMELAERWNMVSRGKKNPGGGSRERESHVNTWDNSLRFRCTYYVHVYTVHRRYCEE